jgi:hypothetical protein
MQLLIIKRRNLICHLDGEEWGVGVMSELTSCLSLSLTTVLVYSISPGQPQPWKGAEVYDQKEGVWTGRCVCRTGSIRVSRSVLHEHQLLNIWRLPGWQEKITSPKCLHVAWRLLQMGPALASTNRWLIFPSLPQPDGCFSRRSTDSTRSPFLVPAVGETGAGRDTGQVETSSFSRSRLIICPFLNFV